MNDTQEKSLQHLTGSGDLSQVQTERLQQLTQEYPWFGPARFFLAAKKKSHGEEWLQCAQVANLYFTNPDWLQLQLDDVSAAGTAAPSGEAVTEPAAPAVPSTPFREAETAMISIREKMRSLPVEDEPEEPMEEETEEIAGPEEAETDARLSGMLSEQLADFRKPVDPDATLDIEHEKKKLHTIDYFASQGIKIDLSSIPQDKLTTHLRKFTDWLKQVKTGNPLHQEFASNPEMEKAVAETARSSNETREVVTEAMADVLEKQGQPEKAIQLYIKLSFLFPEKSSYFAAKIEQLKGL